MCLETILGSTQHSFVVHKLADFEKASRERNGNCPTMQNGHVILAELFRSAW